MTLPMSRPAGIDALSRADACPGCHWSKRSALSMASRHDLDCYHALHRLDAVGQRSVIQEGPPSGRVIADIRITAVIARIGIVGDQYFALRESLLEAIK